MQEIKKKRGIDFLETKFVFRFSRTFFWILVGIGSLAFIGSFIFLVYTLFPPIKEHVAEPGLPPKVTISAAEIERTITPPAKPKEAKPAEVKKPIEVAKPKEKPKPTPPPPDPLQATLEAKIGTLKSYFPADQFTWETVYQKIVVRRDAWGNPVKWEKRVKALGLDRYLGKVLKIYPETQKKIEVVEELIAIMAEMPEEKREKALKSYASLRKKKERERKSEITRIKREVGSKRRRAESKYLSEKFKKFQMRMKALKAFGIAFVSVALLGLFLVFLAIERNTRAVQELIRKGERHN